MGKWDLPPAVVKSGLLVKLLFGVLIVSNGTDLFFPLVLQKCFLG